VDSSLPTEEETELCFSDDDAGDGASDFETEDLLQTAPELDPHAHAPPATVPSKKRFSTHVIGSCELRFTVYEYKDYTVFSFMRKSVWKHPCTTPAWRVPLLPLLPWEHVLLESLVHTHSAEEVKLTLCKMVNDLPIFTPLTRLFTLGVADIRDFQLSKGIIRGAPTGLQDFNCVRLMLQSDPGTFGVLLLPGHDSKSPANLIPESLREDAAKLGRNEFYLFTQTPLQRAILTRWPHLIGIDACHKVFVKKLGRIKLIFIMASTYDDADPGNADRERGLSVATSLCFSEGMWSSGL
jgi:hypothetical protein